MLNLPDKPVYRFADVEIDVPRGCLKRGGQEIHLRKQTFQLLLYLLERRERLVTKEELVEHIWQGAAVTDNAILQCMFDLRRALGDNSRRPRFIKTYPKSGYRFIGPVEAFYPPQPSTIEIEEITAVEIEFERETLAAVETAGRGRRRPEQEAVRLLPAPPARASYLPRRAVLAAGGLLVLAGMAFASIYFVRESRRSNSQADIALARVPGKRALVVMFFENQSGDAEVEWLREGLADMLITNLSRSQKLSVLGRGQLHLLLERSGHNPQGNVRLDEALDVARRAQAETIALGSFARLEGKIRVDVQLYDVRAGQLLTSERLVVEQPAELLTQVDLLSMKLASALLAPDDRGRNASLISVMTNNLQAYRYYSLGVGKAHAMYYADAVALFEKAVALDPEFAMAYARIGYTYVMSWGRPAEGKPYLEKGFQLSGRLTEKDRLSINAWYAVAHQDYAAAVEAYRQIIDRYPLEVEAYWRLARLLRGEERLEEAAEVARQGLAVDSETKELYNALGLIYMEQGRHAEALATLQHYTELAPGDANIYDSLGLAHQWAGRSTEAIQAFEKALSLDPQFEIAVAHLGNTYAWQGRHHEALRQYQRLIQIASVDSMRARGYSNLVMLHLQRKEFDKAERAARTAIKYDKQSTDPLLSLALERGDLLTAEKLMAILEAKRLLDRGSRGYERLRSYYRGSLALKRGRAAEAIEHFKEAIRHRPMVWHIDAHEDCLANAYLELGRLDEAIAEYERLLRLNPDYPRARFHLAQAYERKGQPAPARAEYERFLQGWKDADRDLPEIIAARERLAQQRFQVQ